MQKDTHRGEILKILLKEISAKQTITLLADETGMSRAGTWKALKKLEKEKLVSITPIGSGKTSAIIASLNWENPLTEKNLALALTEDAVKNQRWASNFSDLGKKTDFILIYGSILHSPKEAGDIDILAVAGKEKFVEIDESVKKIQKTQAKKIHIISFTEEELKKELEKMNKAFIDAVRNGVVLFGQEKFIRFVEGAAKK